MKTYKVMPHTADVRLWVAGGSLEELFAVALEGMAVLIKESDEGVAPDNIITKKVEIESVDQTALLIDFLSTVLTLSHQNKAVFRHIMFEKLNETNCIAEVRGYPADGFDDDIKAVTYHEANVVNDKSGNFSTMIVFDI